MTQGWREGIYEVRPECKCGRVAIAGRRLCRACAFCTCGPRAIPDRVYDGRWLCRRCQKLLEGRGGWA